MATRDIAHHAGRWIGAAPPPGTARRAAVGVARGAAGLGVVMAIALAAVGWVYALRWLGALRAGPDVAGALPFQQLAGGEAQPLARMLAAWLPAGAVAGLALRALTRTRPAARAAVAGAAAFAVLFVAGAAADAIANSERLAPHLAPQLARPATWLAAGLFALAAGLAPRLRSGRLAVALAAGAGVAWLVLGAVGTYAYGHNYYLYRGYPPPHDPAGVRTGHVVRVDYWSPALGRESYALVYEPPSYPALRRQGVRFPVAYLLHGGPGKPAHFLTIGGLGVKLDELYARRALRPMLVVMPYGQVHAGGPDDEWANTRLGRFDDLLVDTAHAIDRRFPTRADRRHRLLAGLSTGGYGAANITLQHLPMFGAFESWSGYFVENACCAFRGEPARVIAANSPALYVRGMRPALHRWPVRAFLYQGTHDPADSAMTLFAARLRAAGGHVRTALWPGGHNWRLWRAHLGLMLRWASEQLAGPRAEAT